MKIERLIIMNLLNAGKHHREAATALYAAHNVGASRRKKLIAQHEIALNRLHKCEDIARSYLDETKENAS